MKYEAKIELSTYKEERLAYFKVLRNRQRQKLEWLEKKEDPSTAWLTNAFIERCEQGMVLSYLDDVVEMLENEFRATDEKGGAE